MPAIRPRRIVKRMAILIAIPLLLLSLYVESFWALCWLDTKGRNGLPIDHGSDVFIPLHEYIKSGLPGSLEFAAVSQWFLNGCNRNIEYHYRLLKHLRGTGKL